MKNLKFLFSLLSIILITGLTSYSQSSTQGSLELEFKILYPKGITDCNAVLKVYENDKEIMKVEGNQRIISLDLNKIYKIEISDGKMIQHIVVRTHLPDKKKEKLYKYTCKLRYYEGKDSYDKPSADIRFGTKNFKCTGLLYGVPSNTESN